MLGEGRSPVTVQTVLREWVVDQRLADVIRHRADDIGDRAAELPRRGKHPLARLDRSVVAEDHCDHRRAVVRQQTREGLGFVRQRGAEVAIEPKHVACLIQRIDHHAAQRLGHRMQPVFQRCDGPEIAAATPQRPEQIRVFARARGAELPVRGHHVGRDEIVDGQPMLSHQPTQAAAEGQAGDAGIGDRPSRRGQPECLRLVIELAPEHATLRPCRAAGGIHANALHRRHVDDHAAVIRAVAGRAVPATAQREQKLVRSREIDRALDVGWPGASHDQGWTPVDVAIPDLSRGLVARRCRSGPAHRACCCEIHPWQRR